ncbi:MAG TPA: hypothetical protein VMF58_10300 [Rhizomicrobium sp.]|nr:hypothetical protein [Rhizomicrobium sp.]
MKIQHLLTGAAFASVIALGAEAAVLPMDAPVSMGAVTAVCTGVGSAKDDPKYATYPIKLEFSNGGGQFVSNEHVKLMNRTGGTVAEFDCTGPWVLLQLPKGTYSVTATQPDATRGPKTVKFDTPQTGQKRIGIEFPSIAPNQ